MTEANENQAEPPSTRWSLTKFLVSFRRYFREALALLLVGIALGLLAKALQPAYAVKEFEKIRKPLTQQSEAIPLPNPEPSAKANFGVVQFGKQILITFEYTNHTETTQDLESSTTFPAATVSYSGDQSVASGGKIILIVTIDGRVRLGRFDDEIFVFARQQKAPIAKFLIQGQIEHLIEVQPSEEGVIFGDVPRGTQICRNLILGERKPRAYIVQMDLHTRIY